MLDEVVATRLVEHDYGIISNDGFVWVSGDPGTSREDGEYYYCDPALVDLAYKAAVEVLGKEHVFKGTIATGDQFIASETYVERLKKEYDAYACEMSYALYLTKQTAKPTTATRTLVLQQGQTQAVFYLRCLNLCNRSFPLIKDS